MAIPENYEEWKQTASVSDLASYIPENSYPVKSPSTLDKFLWDCHGLGLARLHGLTSYSAPKQREMGSFLHRTLETAVIDMIDAGGKPMALPTLTEIVECEISAQKFGENLDEIEGDEAIESVKNETRAFVPGLHQVLTSLNNPRAAESKLRYTHEGPRHIHEMLGIIDIVDEDPNPGPDGKTILRVRDLKTSATFSPDKYRKSPQMAVYTAAMTANGMPTTTARVDHLRLLKSGVKYSEITMERGPEHWRHLGILLDQMQDIIDQNKFSFSPKSWLCNTGCPLWDRCEFRFPSEPAQSA